MKIMQTITDYIMKSILTTHGDMVVRGAAIPERLAAVALGQVLKSGGVGAKPVWEKPSITDFMVNSSIFPRDVAGDRVQATAGFDPKAVIFFAHDNIGTNQNMSWGFGYAASNNCLHMADDGALVDIVTSLAISIRRDASNKLEGYVSAWGTEEFTVSFTLTGAVSLNVLYLAIG